MNDWHRPIHEDELRRMLRVASGCALGFVLCKLMNWNYGVFYTVPPIILLGMIPAFNTRAILENISAAVLCCLQVGLIGGYLGSHPVLMTLITFGLFVFWFFMMARGYMTFGSNGVLYLSVLLHFASYSSVDVNDMLANELWSGVITSAIAALMMVLIPPISKPQFPPRADKNIQRVRHEVLLGSTVATLSFIVFQVFDLKDSLSAQVTTVLLLFPMHWNGSLQYARKRTLGTLIGVSFGISAQVLLYNHNHSLLLYTPLLWGGIFWFCHAHLKEGLGTGIGFSAMTTTGILFGQYLTPGGDLMFSAAYRFTSVIGAAFLGLMACYAVHRILNNFAATHFEPEGV